MAKMTKDRLRSRLWFANSDDPEMIALYLERYLNHGMTQEELQGGNHPTVNLDRTLSYLSLVKRSTGPQTPRAAVFPRACRWA